MPNASGKAAGPMTSADLIQAEKVAIDARREHLYLHKPQTALGEEHTRVKKELERLDQLRAEATRTAARPDAGPLLEAAIAQREDRLDEIDHDLAGLQLDPLQVAALGAQPLTGLSLSGGGIRSACFNLGLLEGLDRLGFDPPAGSKLRPVASKPGGFNHLELFDYVSSVSGGSYAAGHLATAMLPANLPTESAQTPEPPEYLGKIHFASKTVPGWLWGVGVWFLGVAFQLLKTGSLLVAFLAAVALIFRVLDAPDAMRFFDVLGFHSDMSRGFVPFWFALVVFLVACWLNSSRWGPECTVAWFGVSLVVLGGYGVLIWFWSTAPPQSPGALPFRAQYACLIALPLLVVVVCLVNVMIRHGKGPIRDLAMRVPWLHAASQMAATRIGKFVTSFVLSIFRRFEGFGPDSTSWVDSRSLQIRAYRLLPLLVGLICAAGLVTTGDIGTAQSSHSATQLAQSQQGARELAEIQGWIIKATLSLLGVTSLAFFFPRNLFKSVRQIEDRAAGRDQSVTPDRWRGWEPLLRVTVFLCSHGFILLVIFVLYGLVAHENVSGYNDWRESLPTAAFHRSDFRDADQAWDKIEYDATATASATASASADALADTVARKRNYWQPLAARLLTTRASPNLSIAHERALSVQIRALEALPWVVQVVPLVGSLGPEILWSDAGYQLNPNFGRLYDAKSEREAIQDAVALRISDTVLNDSNLVTLFPSRAQQQALAGPDENLPDWYGDVWEKYHERALILKAERESLRTGSPTDQAAIAAAIRSNNRRGLELYLPHLIRDRVHDKIVYASVVWSQDQWTRFRIILVAGGIWLLCCAVDVNTFSLQKFYRGHVIDSWVRTPQRKGVYRWLHQTETTYRGADHRDRPADDSPQPATRRAPLLLINATLEGNRSLGDEPSLQDDIFSFSRVASGSGDTGHWPNQPDPRQSLARRSYLDIGNIVATSGAFLSPGNVANPALSAILHLLNIQTGYWVHDPGKFRNRTCRESLRFHFGQSLGFDFEGDSRFMLTDGAHVENLGLYVLLQRRCSLIIASDCGQEDPNDAAERRFDALVHVIQQAGIDGIEVGPFLNSWAYRHLLRTGEIQHDAPPRPDCRRTRATGLNLVRPPDKIVPKTSPTVPIVATPPPTPAPTDRPLSPAGQEEAEAGAEFAREHYLFAQIIYPQNDPATGKPQTGLLVYLRPTLTGDEGDALLHGAADCRFPDDDPLDQFYTPSKMSTYRLLGRHVITELMRDPVMTAAFGQIFGGTEPAVDAEHPACESSCQARRSSCVLNRQEAFRPAAGTTWPRFRPDSAAATDHPPERDPAQNSSGDADSQFG